MWTSTTGMEFGLCPGRPPLRGPRPAPGRTDAVATGASWRRDYRLAARSLSPVDTYLAIRAPPRRVEKMWSFAQERGAMRVPLKLARLRDDLPEAFPEADYVLDCPQDALLHFRSWSGTS